jgi:predicted nucleotidyltransferase
MTEMDLAARLAAHLDVAASPGVVSVYLFGSHAEGRAHRDSDLDVGVLFDRSVHATRKARFEASLRLSAALQSELSAGFVDVVVLNDAPPLIGRRIVTEGRRLFCSDPEADHAYVRDIQLRAADLQPFLERMRRIKLEALAPR